jgi:hypothetical protein
MSTAICSILRVKFRLELPSISAVSRSAYAHGPGHICPSAMEFSRSFANSRKILPRYFATPPYRYFLRHFGILGPTVRHHMGNSIPFCCGINISQHSFCILSVELWRFILTGGSFIFPKMSNSRSPPAKPGDYRWSYGIINYELRI